MPQHGLGDAFIGHVEDRKIIVKHAAQRSCMTEVEGCYLQKRRRSVQSTGQQINRRHGRRKGGPTTGIFYLFDNGAMIHESKNE